MHPIFHEARRDIAANVEQSVKRQAEQMASNAQAMMHNANTQVARLIEVTESYLKRGYYEYPRWDAHVGTYRRGSIYCRQLAHSLRRPYIEISTSNYQVQIKMPRYQRFAPIIAPLVLLAGCEIRDFRVFSHPYATIYFFTITQQSPQSESASEWPPYVAWKARLNKDPEWRRLIRADNILPQR